MKKGFRIMGVVLAASLILSAVACGQKDAIRIGSKNFTESMVVAEIYALALENAGLKVERIPSIASAIIHEAIVNNEIDLYPEYTGTGLLSVLQMDLITEPQEVYNVVKKQYADKFKITWLDFSSANDGQGLVVRTKVAKQYGISTISDLQRHATELRFCSQGEFDVRADGIPALTATYGPFDWKSSKVFDNALKYSVLRNDEADVAPAYTTEGELINVDDFTLLEDDKYVWPPYNLVPIVRDPVLKANPKIADALNKVSKNLNTALLTKLNAQVDVDNREVDDVAKEFFNSIK